MNNLTEYDVAFSFAGEDREYVEEVATKLREKGVRVFYDNYERANLWGKDLYGHLTSIYKDKAKYTLLFISHHYSEKLWTNLERKAAQARAFTENQEYILPARFDDTEIEGLLPTVGYIDLRQVSIKDFCDLILEKLNLQLPKEKIFESLSRVQKSLDEAMKIVPYRIVADSEKRFSMYAKHDKATEEMPFMVKSNFKFDFETTEGKEEFEKFKEHFTKGERVEISGKNIESFLVPEFLPDWMKPNITDEAKLILEPLRPEFTIPLRIERRLSNGEVITLDNIELEIVKPGTEEVTLKNDSQNVPYQFTFIWNFKEKTFSFDYSYEFYGFNVFQHLQGLRFLVSMGEEGETNIYSLDTGVKIVDSDKGQIELKNNFTQWVNLFEAIYLIQQKIPISLTLSENNLRNEDIHNIFDVARVIQDGKLEGKMPQIKTLTSLESAKESIKLFEDEAINPIVISYQEGMIYNILGKEVNLGVAVIVVDVFLDENTFNKIERGIKENQEEIELCFTPKEKSVIIDFLKWDCKDRHKRIQITDN